MDVFFYNVNGMHVQGVLSHRYRIDTSKMPKEERDALEKYLDDYANNHTDSDNGLDLMVITCYDSEIDNDIYIDSTESVGDILKLLSGFYWRPKKSCEYEDRSPSAYRFDLVTDVEKRDSYIQIVFGNSTKEKLFYDIWYANHNKALHSVVKGPCDLMANGSDKSWTMVKVSKQNGDRITVQEYEDFVDEIMEVYRTYGFLDISDRDKIKPNGEVDYDWE